MDSVLRLLEQVGLDGQGFILCTVQTHSDLCTSHMQERGYTNHEKSTRV